MEKERRGERGERAGEGDEDDRRAMIGAALRQSRAVEDHQHREVSQGEDLLQDEEVVRGLVHGAEPVPREKKLAREKDAEEQRGEQAAEDELSPVSPRTL